MATLNLWGAHEPLARRLEVAAAGLGALDPDVVLLQEVRAGEGLPNTAGRLAGLLGPDWRFVYAPALAGGPGAFGPGTPAGEEGLAVLARHAIVEHEARELPEARPDERRIVLGALVDLGAARVWCHTTHLHWRLGDGLAREKQVVAADRAARERGGDVHVHILGGDFNAAPDCDEIRFLAGRTTLAGVRTYWQDAFARVRPGEPGVTWSRRNPYVGELAWVEPERRIDYLFVSPERRDGRGRVRDCRVILAGPAADGVWASDHFGVIADVDA
ncbi:MAG TPA: endonuclease/exonuclease/phosphatase family protein [Haliangiales bacterium]|nr:endonuclease/exonuclease/phosphatase family protein [Haliangiales bacterium]